MNVEQKVATLEALLARVKRNAAEARPPRAHLHVVGPVDADDLEATQDLPPELAHAVLPAPASSRTPAVVSAAASPKPPPVESPKPPIVESPKPAPVEAAPESKPRLVALSPPLATAGRGGPVRSPTPTYGVPAQRPAESPKPAAVRPITPQAPPVIAKPITPSVGPKPSVSRPAPAPKTAAKADAPTGAPVHERSGSKTLMGTGLDEMRRALAQLDTKAAPAASPPLAGAQIIADDSTGEGATMVRSSPLERSLPQMAKQDLVEEASTEDEQTVLIPQPTQEELIAASERAGTGARRKLIEDESSEGDTLVKDSPFSAQLIEPEPPTVSKPTPAAQQPAAAAPKVGAMGTMMMPVSPSASPAVASRAPAAPPPPATTASKTVIMEPALATTVQSEAPPEPPPPAPPPPVEMPGVTGASGLMPGPMGGVDDARPLPVQPSFLRDGPVYEAPLPRKKKSRAGAFGVGLAAAALVAAGVFLSLRNGWLDDLIGHDGATTASPSATAAAPASAAPSAKASAAPTAAEAASEVPATAATPASAAPKASASAVASAAPSAAPSANPAAEAGDASALPKNKGILMVTSTQPGVVYVNGKFVGNAGEPLTVDCGIKYIRLAAEGASPGKTPTFVGHGRPLKIACRATTTAELPAAAGLDGPQAPPGDVPSPGNPAPDL